MSPVCENCQAPNPPQRCTRCHSAYYCNEVCQNANWKVHKRNCQAPSDSEGTASGSESEPVVGIKLLSGDGPLVPRGFVPFQFNGDHDIFRFGEVCPFTELHGVPIILFSPLVHLGKREPNDMMDNQPAVYLRIEPRHNFAPPRWQENYLGNLSNLCYAVRRDRQPLTPLDLEAMYAFHESRLDSDYFEYALDGLPYPYKITPKLFREFSESYWEQEKEFGRKGLP